MTIASINSTKITAVKAGCAVRNRSSNPKHSLANTDFIFPSSSDKPTRRRSVSLGGNTPTEDSTRGDMVFIPFPADRSSIHLTLQQRSLTQTRATQLPPAENVTPERVKVIKAPLLPAIKTFTLGMRSMAICASSVRALGFNLSNALNAELPFLPLDEEKNAALCFTPSPLERHLENMAPPQLQRSNGFSTMSPAMPRSLFIPDDF